MAPWQVDIDAYAIPPGPYSAIGLGSCFQCGLRSDLEQNSFRLTFVLVDSRSAHDAHAWCTDLSFTAFYASEEQSKYRGEPVSASSCRNGQVSMPYGTSRCGYTPTSGFRPGPPRTPNANCP